MSTIKIRVKRQDNITLIRLLIAHPMDTGRKKDKNTGLLVPAHFIKEVKIEHKDILVASCEFTTGVSRDPYLSLRLKNGQPGDLIKVSWVDNLGQSDSEMAAIP